MLNRFRRITSDTWFALGLEFFAIVIGVLFALYVNEWYEERQIAEINAIATGRLNEKILQNYEELKLNVQIVEDRYARLAALKVGTESAFSGYLPKFGGYNIPGLKSSVWERMSSDPLTNRIDPLYIEGATTLYSRHRLLEGLYRQIFELAVSEITHDPSQAPVAWRMSKSTMELQLALEREALARHEDFIERFIGDADTDET